MTTATLTDVAPIPGPAYDRTKPETRQAWWDFRRGGVTATDVRDCRQGAKRRRIITEKVVGEAGEEPSVFAWRHGALREPQIAAWVQATYGITPTGVTYASGENSRWIASPDGVMIDPFTGRYEPGTEDSIIEEIKTGVDDLTPGQIDAAGILVALDSRSKFVSKGYYRQTQWQMLVMNATRTLFAWERHNGEIDPETSTYTPVGPPQAVWIMRDQDFIDGLVEEATALLEEIDAARLQFALDGLPPVSPNLPAEHAVLVADYLRALDAEKVAAAAKKKAWDALQGIYVKPADDGSTPPDTSIDGGFARLTVSTTTGERTVVDRDGMRAKARTTVERYEALERRFTTTEPTETRKLTITRPKNAGNV